MSVTDFMPLISEDLFLLSTCEENEVVVACVEEDIFRSSQ